MRSSAKPRAGPGASTRPPPPAAPIARPLLPRVLMAADPAQYSAWGLTAALAAVGERLGGALAVDHVASLDASTLDVTVGETHNVVFLPKLLASADYSKLAMLMVDFMYGGGTVVLGPPGQFANVTGALLTQLLSLTSSKGVAGVSVSVDCGGGATSLRSAPLRSAGWADGDVPLPAPAAWPAALAAPMAADNPVVADAVTCTPLTGTGGEPVYGRVLYEHPTFAGAAVAAEWRRVGGRVPCPGRAYYLGVDWDAAPLEGSWLALLEAVVLQAANTTQSFSTAAPPPPPSAPPSPPDPWLSTSPPPPPSPSPSPNVTSTPPTTSASYELVPWARGRISFTAAGPTSTSGYAAPAPVTTPRRTLLCHDLPVDNANGGGGSGVNSSSGGEGVWLVIDLGTPRRVRSVRVQVLGAFNVEGVPLRGLADVEVQVRVGLVPAGSGAAGGAPLLGNPRLCPGSPRWLLPPNLPTDPTMGVAALAVECGAEGELVGRHVSVHLLTPLIAARAQLCAVDVVGPAPAGLALASRGKPVCVSPTPLTSQLPAAVHPSLAVDGLYGDNRFGSAGTCGLSVLRADPFMSLDLGGPMVVERVEVTKSALPSLGPSLASFSLLVTNLSCADADNPLTNTGLPPGSFALCGAGLDLEPGSTGVYGCGGAVGRYVVLATKGYTGYLRVCELDVWVALPSSPSSSAPGTPLRLYPVALARPVAVQGDSPVTPKAGQADFSNTTSVAGLLVDGDTPSSLRRGASLGGDDPSELDLTAACVAPRPSTVASPWMAVDLGGTYLVQYVQVHHLYQYDNLPFSALPPLELRLGASAPDPSATQPPGDPACVAGAGLWAGLEGTLDVYGEGANVRRYLCNLSGRYLTLAALRPATAGGQELAMAPVCELEAWGAAVDGTTPGYLSSRGRYALVSAVDGAPLPATTRTATRALRDATPKPGAVAAFAQRCAVAEASAASRRAVWAVDLGAVVNVTRIEILGVVPSKLLQRVDVRLLTSDSDLDPAAPPAAGAGALFPGGGNLTLSSSEVTRLLLPSAGEGVGAVLARHVVVANSVADAQLVLCQVWVYTVEPAGAGSSGGGSGEGATAGPGIRPGVGVARAQGRVAASVGALALEDSLSAMFGQFLSAPRRHHRLLAQQGTQGTQGPGPQGHGRRLLQNPTPPPPVPPTPGPPGSGLLGPASLVLDLGGPRAVEVAVLATQLVSNVYGELTSVVISVSNSSSGAPGPYCVYDATLVLTLSRHLYGCGGAVGRYVVARRTEALGLPPDTTLEALLTDPGTLVSVAALRPTNQSGGAGTGPGGSANAVNGYYSAAAVTAAVGAGLGDSLLYGSATPAVASPWWLVDLGAALPLAWIEITAHPNPDDGLDLVGFEISICNFTVIKGDEGVVLYGNQTLAAGATGRFALGGAVARQVVVRQPGVNRSLQLAQVDVWAPRDALSASVVDLLGPRKPLAFPAVYDAFRTLGTFTDASGTSRFDALAPLTADASAATSAARCAALGPGPSTRSPWLLLDLGADQQVARLELLAAADALPASSLAGAEVLLGGNGTDPEANPVVLSGLPSPAPGAWASYALPARPSGRYLVVRVPVGGATMTVCEVNAYGPSAAELALLPAPSPPPPPPSPLPPAPLDPAPSPPAPPAPPGGAPVNGETIPSPPPASPLPPPFPPTTSSSNATAAPPGPPPTPATPPVPTPPLAPPPPATPIAAKEQTAPEGTTDAVHTDPTAITIVTATVVGATVAATVAATMAASAATSVAGAAAASVGGGTAGSAATLAFVCHLQFFALTSNAAANLSSGYNQTNNGLSWLNLQFDTLGGFGLDLPDAQVQAYSQVVNVFIAYAAVLLLHALLVLALYGTRAWAARRALRRWRRRQGSTASASAVAEATEPSPANNEGSNTKHPSFIARTTSSGPEPPHPSSKSKAGPWQPHMPVLLVFPHPEIFVFLFFVVALGQAAGTLLASGTEQRAAGEGAHRVVPAIAVGSFLLLLLAAAAAAAVALGLRLFRSAGALGLRYVPEPPEPPPAGERESRVRRWIRITERGYWERPEGPEVALLEPTRTERHLAAPFSLGAALAATQAQPVAHTGPPGPQDGDGRNTLYDHMRPSTAGNAPASAPDPEGNGMPAAGTSPPLLVSAEKSGHTALAAAAAGTAGVASLRSRGSSLNGAASAWATPGGAAATAAVGAVSGRSRGVSTNGAASRPPSAVPSRPISAASLLLGGLRRATTTGDGGASGAPDRTGPGTGAGTRSGPMRISDNPLALGGSADSTPAGTPRAAAAVAAAAAAQAGLMQPNAPPALLHAIASLGHTASSAIAAGGVGTALQQGRIGPGGGRAGVAVQDSYDAAPPTPSGGRLVAGTPSRGDLRPSAGRSPLAGRLSASGGSSTLLPPPPVPPPPPPAAPPPPEVPPRPQSVLGPALGARPSRRTLAPQASGLLPSLAAATAVDAAAAAATMAEPAEPPEAAAVVGMAAPSSRQGSLTGRQVSASGAPSAGSRQGSLSGGPVTWTPSARPPPGPGPGPGPGPAGPDAGPGLPPISSSGGAAAGVAAGPRSRPPSGRDRPSASRPVSGIREQPNGRASGDGAGVDAGATAAAGGGGGLDGGGSARWASSRPASANSIGLGAGTATATAAAVTAATGAGPVSAPAAAAAGRASPAASTRSTDSGSTVGGPTKPQPGPSAPTSDDPPSTAHAHSQSPNGKPPYATSMTRVEAGSVLRAGAGTGAGPHEEALPPEAVSERLRPLEVYERYGQLFEEMRGTRLQAVAFQGALLFNAIVPSVLIGIQLGGDMQPHSAGARGSNIALLACKAVFAAYATLVMPYSNAVTQAAEVGCAWLEAGVCGCLVGLQWREGAGFSDAMMACEAVVLAIQILRVQLTTIIPTLLLLRAWWRSPERRRGGCCGCCAPPHPHRSKDRCTSASAVPP
ncbi:hypothetical protein HYH03_007578 [Edaphochlamys debaryana]|uniref:Fucolectin tachylectin-4 pentraxin-1 domain-containing protein n=1 Tax=Edaphochlamys debaryana TaxID=47281 RepID=A0A835Y057_9CHLO|nr:hypothetical protein HYH03_007578 [Edaphochlamys debaryana]|eukprot:KAG2494222.1 hypothetical protein HYH03_007578 [Edaphochlamys debaryana]